MNKNQPLAKYKSTHLDISQKPFKHHKKNKKKNIEFATTMNWDGYIKDRLTLAEKLKYLKSIDTSKV